MADEVIHTIPTSDDTSVSNLLDTYTNLPLTRLTFDHTIPLKEGTVPFNLRPYRYFIV